MINAVEQTTYFYNQHPISCEIIVSKLRASRGHLDGLRPEELSVHDQDHYGGVAANDVLAKCAHIGHDSKVVDFCAGLGRPARYLAHNFGAFVTGVELTPARVRGAAELTRLVRLEDRVKVIEGDVTNVPLTSGSQDAVVSQEALLHVPDIARAFAEAHRVLRPGGRFAFTNWIVHQPLSAADGQLLWDGMAAATLISIDRHAELLRSVGLRSRRSMTRRTRGVSFLPNGCACTRSCAVRPKAPERHRVTTPSTSRTFCSSTWCRRKGWAARGSQH
jgi:sarcosine/dimethylglycine N-methyltransferase